MEIRIIDNSFYVVGYLYRGRIIRNKGFVEVKFSKSKKRIIAKGLKDALEKIAKYYREKGVKKDSIKAKRPMNKKAILQIDKITDEIIAEYESYTEAAEKLGVPNTGLISKCCRNKASINGDYNRTAYGYKWEFKNTI